MTRKVTTRSQPPRAKAGGQCAQTPPVYCAAKQSGREGIMKKIVLLAALCAGAWYYFVGGRTLDEKMVGAYYDQSAHALYKRGAEPMCKQLSFKASMQMYEQIGDPMGCILTVEFEFHIDSIEIEPGRKSAKVKGTSLLKMGETVMQFSSTFNEQLVREMGQMKLLRSDQRTVVRMAGGRGMSQSDFFSK